MLVNIITICYNSEKTIERTILSVLSQGHTELRYIIIDGGSTDETVSIIKKYRDRIAVFTSEADKGIYFAMNKGLTHIQEGLVGILNSDDVFASNDVVSKVVAQIEDSKCDAAYGNLTFTKNKRKVRHWTAGRLILSRFKLGWMPPHPTLFIKSSVYDQYGGFNTKLKLSADYELIIRFLYKYKVNCTYIKETLIYMEVGGASNKSLKNRWRANREDRLAWIANGLIPAFYTRYLKPILKINQFI